MTDHKTFWWPSEPRTQDVLMSHHKLKKEISCLEAAYVGRLLLVVPYLHNYSLVVVNLLPRQHILLVKPLKVKSADPLARKLSSSLRSEPISTTFPLPFDSVLIWPLYEFSSQRDSSVNSWRKRRLCSTVYGSPVACLVQTRALIMGQSGWIATQICRACSLLCSLLMKSSEVSWFAKATCVCWPLLCAAIDQLHLVIHGSTTLLLSLRRLRWVPVPMHSPSVVSRTPITIVLWTGTAPLIDCARRFSVSDPTRPRR